MKRYLKRRKPSKISKRMLIAATVKQSRKAVCLEKQLADKSAELSQKRMEACSLRAENDKLKNKLAEVTKPVWEHAKLHYGPSQPFDRHNPEIWRLDGVASVAIHADISSVRCLPPGDRDAFLRLLVDDFTAKAREHAIANFKVFVE